jgi:hypothetical protein
MSTVTEGRWIEMGRVQEDDQLAIKIGVEGDWRPIVIVMNRPNGDIQYSFDEAEANAKAIMDAVNKKI